MRLTFLGILACLAMFIGGAKADSSIICDVGANELSGKGYTVQTSGFPVSVVASATASQTTFTIGASSINSLSNLIMYTTDSSGTRSGRWGFAPNSGDSGLFVRDTSCSGSKNGETLQKNSTAARTLPVSFGWKGGMEGNYTLYIAVVDSNNRAWTTSTTFQATMALGGASGISAASGSGMSDRTKYIIIGSVCGGVLLIIILITVCCLVRRSKQRKAAKALEERNARQFGNNYTMYTEAQDENASYYYNDANNATQSYYRQSAAPSQTTAWRSEAGEAKNGFV